MTHGDDSDSTRQRDDGLSAATPGTRPGGDEPAASDAPASLPSRRAVLRTLAASGAAATAGCNLMSDSGTDAPSPTETDGGDPTGTPTPTATDAPTETPAPTQTDDPTETPGGEPAYEKQAPQLETEWTEEVGPDNARPEYPRPQLVREEWANLNGVWQFAGASEGESPPVGEELPERVLVPYPIESALSGVKRHETRMWYRRGFTVPDEWNVGQDGAQRLLLRFERVDWEATVYVNGEEVTSHRGGYDHFTADVTEHLTNEGPQELVLGVFDPTGIATSPRGSQPKGRQGVDGGVNSLWKSPASGIWDTVWMEPVAPTRVESLEMTPDLDAEALRLAVNAANGEGATVEATALADGDPVGSVSGAPGEELELSVPDPNLWSPDDPYLYGLRIRLLDGDGTAVDAVESYFGMRSLGLREINGVARPTLNGEVVYYLGSLDSGYWPDGVYTAPTDEAQRFHLEAQKRLGFNAVRPHSKLETRRWFHWTDRLGLLVWQDIPNMDEDLPDDGTEPHPPEAREHFKTEVERMVTKHDTYPSMAVWTAFNEGWGIDNANGEYVAEVTDLIAELDPERIVDAMSGHNVGSNRDYGVGDVNDVHEYPGPMAPEPEPDRYSANGEYSSTSLVLPDHTFGNCNGATDPETFVLNYVDSVERLEELAVGEGLGASVYTATTDLAGVCNGQISYDRAVVKPELADDGVERVREAHERLLRTGGLAEHAAMDVSGPDTYRTGEDDSAAEPLELSATVANPESVSRAAKPVDDLAFELFGVPDAWTVRSTTATEFDVVADGESVTATWEITPETAEDAVELYVHANFAVDGESHRYVVAHEFRESRIAAWSFDETTEDEVSGYASSLEGGAEFDADAARGSHSVRLDGSSGYVLLSEFEGAPGFLHEAFRRRTVSLWIRPDATSGRQVIFNEGGTVNGFGIRLSGGRLEAGVANGEADVSVGTAFDRTAWTHVAAVFDEGALRLYVDGELAAEDEDVGYDVVPSHVAGAELGGSTTSTLWGDGDDAYFGGNVDAASFYRRALPPEDVAALADRS